MLVAELQELEEVKTLITKGQQLGVLTYGDVGARPVPGDYDGDGSADPATYLESTGRWRALPSRWPSVIELVLGGPGQVPVF